jgi:hypothetical protein
VVKDLRTYKPFIDLDSDALHKRADAIILPFVEKNNNSNTQVYTLHESVVKERVSMEGSVKEKENVDE